LKTASSDISNGGSLLMFLSKTGWRDTGLGNKQKDKEWVWQDKQTWKKG